jgi:hypothetical protein
MATATTYSSLAIVVAALAFGGGTARATSNPVRSLGHMTVEGMCVSAGSDGTVTIAPCNPGDPTQLNMLNTNGEISVPGGNCLDVAYGNNANGTRLIAYPCTGGTNQQFQWNVDGSLSVLGKCVDLPYGNNASGSPLEVWDCSGGYNQKFNFVTPAPGEIHSVADTSKCVDVAYANTANGAAIDLYECGERYPYRSNQTLQFADDGTIRVMGKCLDVPYGNTANGTLLELWDCSGGTNQQFVYAADNSIRVLGKCLDLPYGNTADLTQIQLWDCNGGTNQQWSLSPNHTVSENMIDRCSGEVAFTPTYDGLPTDPGTIVLKRDLKGNSPYTEMTRSLDSNGFVRWWCHSTTGNIFDLGTWRVQVNGSGLAACLVSIASAVATDGATAATATPCLNAISISSSAFDGWTPERSRCGDHSGHFNVVLGPDGLLETQCLE